MLLRWIYKTWNFLLRLFTYAILFVLVLSAILMGILQLPASKIYIVGQVQQAFNNQHRGTIEVGELNGLLPFRAELNDVSFYSPDDLETPILSADQLFVSLDVWNLVRGNINITELDLRSPELSLARHDEKITINTVFERKEPRPNDSAGDAGNLIQRFTIFAPEVHVTDGRITSAASIMDPPEKLNLPDTLSFTNITTTLLVESLEQQQFVDIISFSASSNIDDAREIEMQGQLFSDGIFLELNGFEFSTEVLTVELSAESTPVDIFSGDLRQQFSNAAYRLDVNRLNIDAPVLNRLTDSPKFRHSLEISGLAEGTLDSLWLDNIQATNGESYLIADGLFEQIQNDLFTYDIAISNLVLNTADISEAIPENQPLRNQIQQYGTAILQGNFSGGYTDLQARFNIETDTGNADFETDANFGTDSTFTFTADLDSLDISPFAGDSTGSSILNGSIIANGSGYGTSSSAEATFRLASSRLFDHGFETISSDITVSNGTGEYSATAVNDQTEGTATGEFSLFEPRQFSIDAYLEDLDVTQYITELPYNNTSFNGRVTANAGGTSLDDLQGRLSIEINRAIIDEDTLRPHQFYADVIDPGNDEPKEIRMTSSFFNANIAGTLYPDQLISAYRNWYNYLGERVNEELFFEKMIPVYDENLAQSDSDPGEPIDLSLQTSARDLELLKAYIPALPDLRSSATANLSINATNDRLSVNGTFFDDSLRVNNSHYSDVGVTLTGNIQKNGLLKNGTILDIQFNSPAMELDNSYNVEGVSFNMSLRDSLLSMRQQVDSALENLSYITEASAVWNRDEIKATVDTLSIGSNNYSWQAIDSPGITYRRDGSITLDRFIMESRDDYFEIDGTFSNSYEDSVSYTINSFNLSRVSELVGGRIQFEGILNGEFTTQALSDVPSIQGDLSVTEGRINNRVVGDVTFRSRFNSDEERFDTEIHLLTDPEKYADYLEVNDGIGHDLRFEGYFRPPDEDNEPDEDLVYFDADFREIDMWIVTFIVPNIIEQMEGSATGSGFFRLNQDGYDFEADFDVEDVYGVPAFLNVPYSLSGNLTFNRSDGLLFHEVLMDDGEGGTGLFTGQVDLDDFGPQNFLDLQLEMDELRFMNNIQDPNVPFVANLYGSGTAVLDGSSSSPSLRSQTPLNLTTRSSLSIPLQEETELEQDRRFIQFVESFELLRPISVDDRPGNGRRGNGSQGEVDLTFLELFTMNLQFVADDPVQVQLIFDPVTNDVLNANGTGQITLILEDQDLSMFGRFNVSGGDYQFVGGDIFTRRFDIQDGGTISWQGDPDNASLNVTASYRARPDISTLLPTGTNFQRIPIELILQIGGTISQIENEFYFQLPSGIEGTQDPTITAQINRLNQNEDEKVLQAFGILLTGNFVPSDELENPEFGNVTGTNALVNPLVSSQIISPLLSNQINSLLRSDITFDVDFNLNAFNEVDLGVALRLFNDRIVLRREGQITGDSELGDLGATYRINNILSLTAFHRQDITLSNRAETESRQTQEMNGMGLEAQFQFNTWKNLKDRLLSPFRKLFGMKENEPEVEEDSDSLANQ